MVPSRSDLISFEVPLSTRPDDCVLADAEQTCHFAAADQLGAADQIGRCCSGVCLDVM